MNRFFKTAVVALACLVASGALAAAGQSPAQPRPGSVAAAASSQATGPVLLQRDARYRLRKGDSFEADFVYSPEFNQTLAVEPDGFVSLKEIGSIHVEGQTVPELTATLSAAYAKILHDPVVVVSLKDVEKPYFLASGEVSKPGKYDLRVPLTVTQGVAIAGGFNDAAKHSQVVLFHPMPSGLFEAKLLNVKKLLASRNLNEDLYLQPGDLIYVPTSTMSKIRKYLPQTALGAYYNPATY